MCEDVFESFVYWVVYGIGGDGGFVDEVDGY